MATGNTGGHAWARPVMIAAWARVHPGYTPTEGELLGTQSLCAFDGAYGRWKESAAANAHNWGAVQHSVPKKDDEGNPVCPPGSFLRDDVDVHGGSGKRSPICFVSYPDDVSGAAHAVKHMTTHRPQAWAGLKTGDMQRFAAGLYADRYFGGFHSPKKDPDAHRKNVTEYANNLWSKAVAISRDLGIPMAMVRGDLNQAVGPYGGTLPPYGAPSTGIPTTIPPGGSPPDGGSGSSAGASGLLLGLGLWIVTILRGKK